MTIPRLPMPSASLQKAAPELAVYLTQLVTQLQTVLNNIDNNKQTIARPFVLQQLTAAQVLTQFQLRLPDVAKMAYCPSFQGDPALVISDGSYLRTVTVGAPLSTS